MTVAILLFSSIRVYKQFGSFSHLSLSKNVNKQCSLLIYPPPPSTTLLGLT